MKQGKLNYKEIFSNWLEECGNGLNDYGGPDGVEDLFDKDFNFDNPEIVDKILNDGGYYENGYDDLGEYKAPSEHYLDWFRRNYE